MKHRNADGFPRCVLCAVKLYCLRSAVGACMSGPDGPCVWCKSSAQLVPLRVRQCRWCRARVGNLRQLELEL